MISITLLAGCSATPSNINNTTPVSTNNTTITEQQPMEQQTTTQPVNNWIENNNQKNNERALIEIRKEEKVKEAIITDANVVYVSVNDDGTRRDWYAEYICQLIEEFQWKVWMVKITEFWTTNSTNRDNAYGNLLWSSNCVY